MKSEVRRKAMLFENQQKIILRKQDLAKKDSK